MRDNNSQVISDFEDQSAIIEEREDPPIEREDDINRHGNSREILEPAS